MNHLRRSTFRTLFALTRSSMPEEPSRKALTQNQLQALKLRMHVIKHGDRASYLELINTLCKIQGMEDQLSVYVHPAVQHMVEFPLDKDKVASTILTRRPINTQQLSIYFLTGVFVVALGWIYKDSLVLLESKIGKLKTLSKKGNADIQVAGSISERFTDVLGIDQFREELEEIVDFIRNRDKYLAMGAKLPKGILMVGPPGTGKTLMGRALAGEAGSNFIYKSGSQFEKKFVGQGAKQIRKLFELVKKDTPTIIFIDQIDTLAKKRTADSPSFTRDTLNQLLQEMDGFSPNDNIIIIGATNHKQSIDSALLRPGRFDKVIHVPMPDQKGRLSLLNHYIAKIKNEGINTEQLSKKIIGFSGADIKNLANLAILHAIRNNRKAATNEDFDSSITRIRMGVGRKNMFVSQEDKLMTALHQIGHAFTSVKTKGAIPFNMVTILPRGQALGFTSMVPENDTYSMTKQQLEAQIDCLMGGRAAQELFFGDSKVTTGCSSDLSRATQIAYEYTKNYGMNPKIGLISQTNQDQQNATSDKFNSFVDKQVNVMLKDSYLRVLELLRSNRTAIQKMAKKLVQKQTMNADEFKEFM